MRRQTLCGLAALSFAISGCGPLADLAAMKVPTMVGSPASEQTHPKPPESITPVEPVTTIEQPAVNDGEPAELVNRTPAPLPTSDVSPMSSPSSNASPVSVPTTALTPELSPSPSSNMN